MRDLSLPLTSLEPARWAARPAHAVAYVKLVLALGSLLPFVLAVLVLDQLTPGQDYPSHTGVTGWVE